MILYAAARCGAAEDPPSTRVAHALQSATARDLQALLGASTGIVLSSRSHSRTMVAAAVAQRGTTTRLGIDIEYCDPARAFGDILRIYDPSRDPADPLTAETFYRCWTFIEAYYKAFGRHAEPGLVRRIASAPIDGQPIDLGGGIHAMHKAIDTGFRLALVWCGAASPLPRFRWG